MNKQDIQETLSQMLNQLGHILNTLESDEDSHNDALACLYAASKNIAMSYCYLGKSNG